MLTKEQWRQSPTWARYHAFDKNGDGYWYSVEPIKNDMCFFNSVGGKRSLLQHTGKDWQKTLEPRPFDTYPCPFCGGSNTSVNVSLEGEEVKEFYVLCFTRDTSDFYCGTGPIRPTEEEAWQAWATRV